MPLAEDVIKSLINEKIREQDIEPWAIRNWSDKNLTAYIPSISIHHTGDKLKDKERGHFIIRSAIRWAISLDKQYDIKKWYAIAATPEGENLVQHLGFEKIEGKRDAYVLTDFKKATKPIRAFINKLEQEESSLVPAPKNGTHKPNLTADLTAISAYNPEQSVTPANKRVHNSSLRNVGR
jgi:hypothetical protein